MLNSFLILFLPLFLGGCIGSSFVVDETNHEAQFPSLHTVPEYPNLPNNQKYQQRKDDLLKEQKEVLLENKRLRQKFKQAYIVIPKRFQTSSCAPKL